MPSDGVNKQQLIEQLQLEPHREGGYFRRTYASSESISLADKRTRPCLSSIYYLLTDDSPIGYFHRNRSDILHYWQQGSALTYYLIDPQGQFNTTLLGPDLAQGQQLQLLVPGGYWKATRLNEGEFGLLSEAVCPGFDYNDMQLASSAQLQQQFPQLWQQLGDQLAQLCQG